MPNFKLIVTFLSIIGMIEAALVLKKPFKAKEAGNSLSNEVSSYSSYTPHNRENWGDAWRHCKDNGGHLLIIDSKGELEFVVNLIHAYGLKESIYLGVHDMFQEGRFITVKGDDLMVSKYNIWAPGEPNNYMDTEDCVMLTTNGLLHDVSCSSLHYYFCEYEWFN